MIFEARGRWRRLNYFAVGFETLTENGGALARHHLVLIRLLRTGHLLELLGAALLGGFAKFRRDLRWIDQLGLDVVHKSQHEKAREQNAYRGKTPHHYAKAFSGNTAIVPELRPAYNRLTRESFARLLSRKSTMLFLLLGILVTVVVGAICFYLIDRFVRDGRLANLLKLLVVLLCLISILQRLLPALGINWL